MAGSIAPNIITDGLVLYLDAANNRSYPGSGTSWLDLSGNSNNGTLNGSPSPSFSNNSFLFNGSNDVTFSSNPQISTQLTVDFWIRVDSTTPNTIGWICGRETSYRLLYTPTVFSWVCSTTNNGWYSSGTFVDSVTTPTASNIYNVVATYNGTNNRIYVNGVLESTGSNISGNVSGGGSYRLFLSATGNVDNGKGNLYSHKIYNRALSDREILQNYNATKSRFGIIS